MLCHNQKYLSESLCHSAGLASLWRLLHTGSQIGFSCLPHNLLYLLRPLISLLDLHILLKGSCFMNVTAALISDLNFSISGRHTGSFGSNQYCPFHMKLWFEFRWKGAMNLEDGDTGLEPLSSSSIGVRLTKSGHRFIVHLLYILFRPYL